MRRFTVITLTTAALAAAALPVAAQVPGRVQLDTLSLSTGVRLHYAAQGAADGMPVILLHGYTDSWYSFTPLLARLPDEYRVYALDQRGHGRSQQPAAGYALRDLAADVLAFLDAKQLERAVLVSHSMGSLVAQQVAQLAPDRVTALVLIGSGTSVRKVNGIDDFAGAVRSLEDPVPEDFVRGFQQSTLFVPVPPDYFEGVVAESRRLPAPVWKALFEGMMEAEPVTGAALADIPTLLAWGEQDALFPRSEQDALRVVFRRSELRVYPETGHAPHWERPAEVADDLVRFMRQHAE